ncbi:flavodoxin [Clostridium sp. BSD9I1]|uniref:flavodoxin n=1 Tax=Clostridium sp. BSD9I1 TaxID=2003589 RepID=UPI001644ED66|nr:flavodoxin [Clostridium sp. BSD9I1]
MKKIAVIYWSYSGNVEVLADNIAKGAKEAGAEVLIKHVDYAKVEDVLEADVVAFGSPSMDNNRVEQEEMAPFIHEFKLLPVNKKPVVLFGSYGWDNGEFLNSWEAQMKDYDFNIIEKFAVKEAPSEEQIQKAVEIGKRMAELKEFAAF